MTCVDISPHMGLPTHQPALLAYQTVGNQDEAVIELSCCIAPDYPNKVPILSLREGRRLGGSSGYHQDNCNDEHNQSAELSRAAADKLQLGLMRHLNTHSPPGEQHLFEAIRWLQENAASSFTCSNARTESSASNDQVVLSFSSLQQSLLYILLTCLRL